jgi:hypothetical protein
LETGVGPAPNDEEEQQALKSIPDLSCKARGNLCNLVSSIRNSN